MKQKWPFVKIRKNEKEKWHLYNGINVPPLEHAIEKCQLVNLNNSWKWMHFRIGCAQKQIATKPKLERQLQTAIKSAYLEWKSHLKCTERSTASRQPLHRQIKVRVTESLLAVGLAYIQISGHNCNQHPGYYYWLHCASLARWIQNSLKRQLEKKSFNWKFIRSVAVVGK